MNKLQSALSGVDSRSAIMVAGALLGLVTLCGLMAYAVIIKNQAFDAVSFGTGFGAWVAATGGGLGLHTYLSAGPVAQGKTPND